jgi:hypothetical protein
MGLLSPTNKSYKLHSHRNQKVYVLFETKPWITPSGYFLDFRPQNLALVKNSRVRRLRLNVHRLPIFLGDLVAASQLYYAMLQIKINSLLYTILLKV